ncbi:MAG TPA: hypothetical protein VMW62_09405 [Chloroflexota bacterium]|nr:hypothetical protein [Chloroflexota bacterium]
MRNANEAPMFPIGALEIILECQEILAGKREHLTSVSQYTEQRRRYWQMQALRPRLRSRSALHGQAA